MKIKRFLILIALMMPAGFAFAATHTVGGSSNCGSYFFSETGPDSISLSGSGTSLGCTASSSGTADGGHLGVSADVKAVSTSLQQESAGAKAESRFSFTIGTPAGYNGELIPIQVSVDVHAMSVAAVDEAGPPSTANDFTSTKLEARINLSASWGFNGDQTQIRYLHDNVATKDPNDAFPAESRVPIEETIATNALMINANGTVTVTLLLDADAFLGTNRGEASLNALNSLSFTKNGPAFILPEGFTINSAEANIVDNMWIDPRPVPLPASGLLMLGAMGGMAGWRRLTGKLRCGV